MQPPEKRFLSEARGDDRYVSKTKVSDDPNKIIVGGVEYDVYARDVITPVAISESVAFTDYYVSDDVAASLPAPPPGWKWSLLTTTATNARYATVTIRADAATSRPKLRLVQTGAITAAQWWGNAGLDFILAPDL